MKMSNSKKNSEKNNKKSLFTIRPDTKLLETVTDRYFLRTKEIVSKFGDTEVTYAIFMRRPVLSAICPAIDWLQEIIKERKGSITINRLFNEGDYVGAGEPLVYISGSMLKDSISISFVLVSGLRFSIKFATSAS